MASHSQAAQSARFAEADPFLLEHGYTRAPTLLQWMATLRCGLSCAHCLSASRLAGHADMPLAQALHLVDQAAELGVEELLVTGGEPLLREDLVDVIARLGARGMTWSLNTAVAPTAAQREAMRRHPPALAAVSVDGPAEVHDTFRGRRGALDDALEAIAFFRTLPGCSVTAGTTVTTKNLARLRETRSLVAASGAHRWGLHLLLPEGRAATRADLFLDRRQTDALLAFAARSRTVFPTSICDEIGYLGDREPLVRDVPWACGAGVAQCVVLPDGSVVPCTTLDRTTSAGNLRDRSLAELWREGFAELRRPTRAGACGDCGYARACRGGCWLQRRAGSHCFKDAWEVPGALRTALGVALCFGLGACASERPPVEVAVPAPAVTPSAAPAPDAGAAPLAQEPAPPGLDKEDVQPGLEAAILDAIARPLRPPRPGERTHAEELRPLDAATLADPAGQVFLAWSGGKLPAGLAARCALVKGALGTSQRSLAFAALAFRIVSEPLLTGTSPEARSPAERALLRETLDALGEAADRWQREVFRRRLDPFLARDRMHLRHRFEMAKASIAPPAWLTLARDTAEERWGGEAQQADPAWALSGFLGRHPYAEGLALEVDAPAGAGVHVERAGTGWSIKAHEKVGIFERVTTSSHDVTAELGFRGATPLSVVLPARAELTWADLLALADRQHAKALDAQAARTLASSPRGETFETDPRLASAMARAAAAGGASAAWWLADLWLF